MRTFLLTVQQAGKLPRWALLLLCALYALPGFVGRDPWRVDYAAGFGVALTMARGGLDQWLMPGVFGEPVVTGGPLPFWLSALLTRLFHLAPEHVTVRAAAVLGLALMWILLWYATYELARRPGVQPSDPFEAAASRTDFGRAIADSALLLMLATLGLLVRLHETTAAAAQLTFVCLFMFGAASAPAFPRRGGILTGLGIAAIGLTSGWPSALALMLAMWAGVPAMLLGTDMDLNATTTAMIGLSLLLLTGVLEWEDILKAKSAWDTLIWFAALVMMATFLGKLGLIGWFSLSIQNGINHLGLGWISATVILVLIYFYSHYFFASTNIFMSMTIRNHKPCWKWYINPPFPSKNPSENKYL